MDVRIAKIKSRILSYPNFPKPGINFYDVFSAMRDPEALVLLMQVLREKAASLKHTVDCVVALDARGFLFGPTMAEELGVPFIPVRKQGKLPGECHRVSYDLEYGSSTVELQKEAFPVGKLKVLVVDDLLATGGSMRAVIDLVEAAGSEVVECFAVMELKFLNGRQTISERTCQVTSLISFDS